MGNIKIISNNPQVLRDYPRHTQKVEGGVLEVYTAARDEIHRGAVLINHPLSGSVKPNQSPYRSLLVSDYGAETDLDSLALIEGAMHTLRRLPKLDRRYTERTLADFQFVDHSLLAAAVQALPAKYYF